MSDIGRRLIGPGVALLGALVTFPSMLGADNYVRQNMGQGWTIAIIVVALALGALLVVWRPGWRWVGIGIRALAGFLIAYALLIPLWSLLIVPAGGIPAADLPYLYGLPLASLIGGGVALITFRRLRRNS